MKKTQQNFRMDANMAALLEDAAEHSGLSKALIVEDALTCYIGDATEDIRRRQKFILSAISGKNKGPVDGGDVLHLAQREEVKAVKRQPRKRA